MAFLLGKSRDLSLADSQVTRLAAIDAKLIEVNRLALRKIDSVQADLRPAVEGTGAPSECLSRAAPVSRREDPTEPALNRPCARP